MTPIPGRVSRSRATGTVLVLLVCALAIGSFAGGAGATFPGRNGKLVIVRAIGHGNRQVYIGTRSGHLRLLSRNFGFAAGPDVSPSGKRIVFKGNYRGQSHQQIWAVNPDGTGLRQLTHHDTDSLGPAFGANGRFILYDSYANGTGGDSLNIWRLSLRTGDDRPLFGAGPRSPAVSPGGRIFVYVDQSAGGYTELWTARVDGTHRKRLTHERYWADQPDFSPNGRWIVYTTLRPCQGGSRTAIVATNPTGTKQRLVAKGCGARVSAPVFSPNGHWVSFFRNGIGRIVPFPGGGRPAHLLAHRPSNAIDSNLAWQAR